MWQKIFQNKISLTVLTGISVVLAFPRYELIPTILFFPFLLNRLLSRTQSYKEALGLGYLLSFVILVGGFYWVTHVIHAIGELPWSLSILLFFGFCLIGALNFPVFFVVAYGVNKKFKLTDRTGNLEIYWMTLILPALFCFIEFAIPKLFPWYIGHSLYRMAPMIQICDLTGTIALSFGIFTLGSGLSLFIRDRIQKVPYRHQLFSICGIFWLFAFAYGTYRMNQGLPSKSIQVASIQANIGSLDRVAAGRGVAGKVRYVMDSYIRLTEQALASTPKPELIVWPETAMPFQMQNPYSAVANEIRQRVLRWGVPLLTGAYAPSLTDYRGEYNAAILLEPLPNGGFNEQVYEKNILLAFGEYMPFGDWFPSLYSQFPQVSNFARGTTQKHFTMMNQVRLGVSICYEAIVPSFYRKVMANKVNVAVNLTNDSWFGVTAEPYQHGALAVFRAVESRVPLVRVTNTGTSFSVDTLGRISEQTGVYQEGVQNQTIYYSEVAPLTPYIRFGDWFAWSLGVILVAFLIWVRRNDASLSH